MYFTFQMILKSLLDTTRSKLLYFYLMLSICAVFPKGFLFYIYIFVHAPAPSPPPAHPPPSGPWPLCPSDGPHLTFLISSFHRNKIKTVLSSILYSILFSRTVQLECPEHPQSAFFLNPPKPPFPILLLSYNYILCFYILSHADHFCITVLFLLLPLSYSIVQYNVVVQSRH